MGLVDTFSLSDSEQRATREILKHLEGFTHRQREKILLNVNAAVTAGQSAAPHSEDTYQTRPNGHQYY